MNVAPDPLGRWPASALQTLDELTEWFAINGEAIHNTRPAWPYQYGDLFVSGSQATKALYVLIPVRATSTSTIERRGSCCGTWDRWQHCSPTPLAVRPCVPRHPSTAYVCRRDGTPIRPL